ncbi:hypothetical protein K9L67_04780 [Candidatus Woesearchaeota archaeon]|nr:hypothetical protein [Candidatus Woesearchaeota archaeon]MCF7901515.1 hypothetical protein [Candidatus Woesearchaeota archaeon]MCF8013934.1 hypothetical protein [Candidatus Woesearchaeota archaeon]
MAKRLSSSEKAERRKRRNSLLIGFILIFLMVFGTLGAFYGGGSTASADSTPGFEYENYKFDIQTDQNGNSFYITDINDVQMPFYSTPYQVKALNVSGSFWQRFYVSPNIVFTSPALPKEGTIPVYQQYLDLVASDIRGSTGKNVLRGFLQKDFFNEGSVFTCDNADNSSVVIVYKGEPDELLGAGIYESDKANCYDLIASAADLILLRDYVVYVNWGILNG